MRVYVRRADLNVGVRGLPGRCPLAVTLKRYFPEARAVNVYSTLAYVIGMDRTLLYDLGDAAKRFVRSVDTEGGVQPQSLTVTYRGEMHA